MVFHLIFISNFKNQIWAVFDFGEKKKKDEEGERLKKKKSPLFNFLISQYQIDEVEGEKKKDNILQSLKKYLILTG